MEEKKPLSRDPKKKAALIVLTVIAACFLFLAGFGSGVFQFGFSMVTCGRLPVVATKFLTATYYLPGDSSYGPGGVFTEYFCTEQQAISAGYSHDSFSTIEHEQ